MWGGGGGGVEILLVASCYGNRDKLQPDEPVYTSYCHNEVVHNNSQIVRGTILKAEGLFDSFMLKRHCNCQWFLTGNPREFVIVNMHQGMVFDFWNGPLWGRVKSYSVEGQKLKIDP